MRGRQLCISARFDCEERWLCDTGQSDKIGTSEVEYKKWSNQDGPQYSIAIPDILAINYKNGEKETFDNVGANKTSSEVSINILLSDKIGI